MLLQFLFQRLLHPILDAALLRVVVLPIGTEDGERRVGTLLCEEQCGLTRGVTAANHQRFFPDPRVGFAEMIVNFG